MPFRPSPHPWRIEDYQGRGYQILAADGTQVALLHYPKGTDEAANCKLVQKSAELLHTFRGMRTLAAGLLMQLGKKPSESPVMQVADKLIEELEIRDPVKRPPAEMI